MSSKASWQHPSSRLLIYSSEKERKTHSVSPEKTSDYRLPPLLAPITYTPFPQTSFRQSKRHPKPSSLAPIHREKNECIGLISRLGPGGISGKPIGVGFLITSNVVLTSRSVIHTEEEASRCRISFGGREEMPFATTSMFVSAPDLNLIVIGIDKAECGQVVDIVQRFTLKEDDRVRHVGYWQLQSRVKIVESQRFYFRSENPLLPGIPVFDDSNRFQGVTVSASTPYMYNESVRSDCLTSALLVSGNFLKHHAKLKALLSKIYHKPIQERDSDPAEELCWFEWLHKRVIRYDILSERWTPGDAEALEDAGDWQFPWGCKSVQLPDCTYLLIGGSVNDSPCNSVFHYSSVRNRITRCENLKLGRMSCAVVYCSGTVFALGGEYANGSCEKCPLADMRWTYITSMTLERHSMNAIAMAGLVYIVGGAPLAQAGHSIDRYYPQQDLWEKLAIVLPEAVCNSGLSLIASDTFAIIGGRMSRRVFALQVAGSPSSFLISSQRKETLHECPELLRNTETLYPVFVSARTESVFVFNSHEAQHRPVVAKYQLSAFRKSPLKVALQLSRREDAETTTPLSASFIS